MKVQSCDCYFKHKPGEFGIRMLQPYYFVGYFYTPFSYQVENNFLIGEAGDVLVVPADTIVYHGPRSKEESFTNDWIYIGGDDFEKLLNKFPLPLNQAFHIGKTNPLSACIQQVQQEQLLQQEGYEDIINSKITETIVNIYRLYQQKHLTAPSISRIETARASILRNLNQHWTLKEMALLSGYSVSRFSSLYRETFGLSPMADLLNNRIHQAKQLLRYSGLSVTDVSRQCGFQSIYYFSKYFKAATGVAPSEFANHWKLD